MNLQTGENSETCPNTEFSAYIDGELSACAESDLEFHLAGCKICTAELNEQKKVLFALDSLSEEKKNFRLPENFTKVIVANAESEVSGLRRPQERFRAFFVCALLFLLALLSVGGQTKAILFALGKFSEQFLIVVRFLSHFFYDAAVGISVIFRSLSYQIVNNSTIPFFFAVIFLIFAFFAVSRLVVRQNRI